MRIVVNTKRSPAGRGTVEAPPVKMAAPLVVAVEGGLEVVEGFEDNEGPWTPPVAEVAELDAAAELAWLCA